MAQNIFYDVEKLVDELRALNKKIVFTNGCFDILHVGHVSYLFKAKELGDILVVALNSDASVKRLKGDKRPINSLKDRMIMMASLKPVDYVTYFDEDTPYEIIKKIQPDILVKGGDWKEDEIVGADIVKKKGGKVFSLNYEKGFATTNIIDKILNIYCEK
ncbi:D-glycero-beta-D-manno-heptose 1-phosphate adenylyltransferase [Deferribacter abyssi]|uniref:D-glycero-beta-D-manno-heptose 1-phosphate adenylyltransferase n=1 Tax=Deferribacter abyssi TaxID=213806 RepID=UPI003C293827